MPLSDHEQQMLDEMERQLFAEDPRLARTFDHAVRPRRDRRRILLGIIGIVVGLGLLVLSVSLPAIWLGVVAFLVMVAGGVWAATAPMTRTASGPEAGATGPGAPTAPGASPFMRRMEERWERRGDSDQQG